MINFAGLVLVALSMAAAGVWSPPPESRRPEENLLLKEGHRVIVVEYEREGLRSPYDLSKGVQWAIDQSAGAQDTITAERRKPEGLKEELKEKFREAAEVLPNLGQGVSPSTGKERQPTDHHDSKVCDAYGVCREKISGMFGPAKEKATEVSNKLSGKAAEAKAAAEDSIKKAMNEGEEMTEKGKEGGKKVGDKVEKGAEKTAEIIGDKAKAEGESTFDAVMGGAKRIVDEGSEKAGEFKDKAQHAYGHAKEKVQEVKEDANDAYNRVGEKAQEGKEKAWEAYIRASEKAQESREKAQDAYSLAEEKVQEAMDRAKNIIEDGKRNLTEIIQRGKDVVYDAAMYAVSRESMVSLLSLLHSLAFSVVFGTCFWVTFVSSYVLLRALPRQQFGIVQSKIYPVYFRMLSCGIGICFLTQFFMHTWVSTSRADKLQAYNLLVSLGFVLTNMIYLEPRATKVMYDRLKLEKEEGRGLDILDMDQQPEANVTSVTGNAGDGVTVTATTTTRTVDLEQGALKSRLVKMNRRLKNLNNSSSFLNMMTLMGLTWHLVYLSQRQQISCRATSS